VAFRYLSADQLLSDSQQLALNVLTRDYKPELLIALWRGGTPIGIAMHETLSYLGHHCEHIPIRVSSYKDVNQQGEVRIWGLEQVQPFLSIGLRRILLVDDVFDSGRSLLALTKALTTLAAPDTLIIRTATPWYKPKNNKTSLLPDFYLHATDDWIVFPHELQGLPTEAVLAKPGNKELLKLLLDYHQTQSLPNE
jgi:uncharacterized protein